MALVGVFELPKAAGETAAGAVVWWNAGTDTVANASGAGFYPIGVAPPGAATGAATVRVRLSGVPVTAVAGG